MISQRTGTYLSNILDNRCKIENIYEKSVNVGLTDIRTELLIMILEERMNSLVRMRSQYLVFTNNLKYPRSASLL